MLNMKKLLMLFACAAFFACTNPEHTVDDPADTAGVESYSNESTPNTIPGGASEEQTEGAVLDTSNAPKDTSRGMRQ